MNEFIEKLISRLEENSFDMSLENPDCKAVWTDEVIKIVNQLAEEYNNGWIPCSERLPFTTGYYLVTIKGFNRPMYAWWLSTEKIWQYLNSTKVIDDVIAWCELPAPYQPKGE